MSHTHASAFAHRQKPLLLVASLYVLALIFSHATLPSIHVWIIAAVFSVLMNFTYLTEAFAARQYLRLEALVMVILVTASLLGLLVHPLFVIAAILGHGLWDTAKHLGAGIPFFSWYTLSCAAVDLTYAVTLLAYWWQT